MLEPGSLSETNSMLFWHHFPKCEIVLLLNDQHQLRFTDSHYFRFFFVPISNNFIGKQDSLITCWNFSIFNQIHFETSNHDNQKSIAVFILLIDVFESTVLCSLKQPLVVSIVLSVQNVPFSPKIYLIFIYARTQVYYSNENKEKLVEVEYSSQSLIISGNQNMQSHFGFQSQPTTLNEIWFSISEWAERHKNILPK